MVETKVKTATLGSFIASLVLALANAVAADSSIMGGLHPVIQFVLLAVLPTIITFLGGYAMPSKTSAVSKDYFQNISGKRID
jgi:hypothetical protein